MDRDPDSRPAQPVRSSALRWVLRDLADTVGLAAAAALAVTGRATRSPALVRAEPVHEAQQVESTQQEEKCRKVS